MGLGGSLALPGFGAAPSFGRAPLPRSANFARTDAILEVQPSSWIRELGRSLALPRFALPALALRLAACSDAAVGSNPQAGAEAPRLFVLVHGGPESSEAQRAHGLTRGYPPERLRLGYRLGSRWAAARTWRAQIQAFGPEVLYVLGTALPGAVLGPVLGARGRLPFVLDTGDVVYEMARSAGTRARGLLPLLRWFETLAQRRARTVVVRGTRHGEYLRSQGYPRVAVIRDGYTPAPPPSAEEVARLRERLGLRAQLVLGVMGSLVYSPRLRICYGWDLVQALALLRDAPVAGLVIGDGPGRTWLEGQARAHHVLERLTFCGWVPYAQVPVYLRLLDVALSTQTNNLAGQVRTTGKLPEYMAAGCYVLATRVGEAPLLLPEPMLLDYDGAVDEAYPRRLAERVRWLAHNPQALAERGRLPAVAAQQCSYDLLSRQFQAVVREAAPRAQAGG